MINQKNISVLTTKHLFNKTKSVIKELAESNGPRKLKILDTPAGAGALTQFLTEDLNADVTPLEIDTSKWEYPAVMPKEHNMDKPLPFNNQSFDFVVCLEGLKHFGNVSQCISEFSRVLKPGGQLVLTIPNDLCMQSRLRYLFDGFVDVDWIKPMDPSSPNEKRFFHLHSLLSLPYLYYFLIKYGFTYEFSKASRLRGWSQLAGFIFYPFIALATRISSPKGHPLRKELRSFTWLAGRHCIIVARKN